MGVLLALGGAACGLLGGAVNDVANSGDTSSIPGVAGLGVGIAVFGIILLVLGVLSIAAGAGALGGKGWARWIGVIVSVLFVILGVLALLASMGAGSTTGLVLWIVITVAYALTAWSLIRASAYFGYRR
jgi:hypothetical protein